MNFVIVKPISTWKRTLVIVIVLKVPEVAKPSQEAELTNSVIKVPV